MGSKPQPPDGGWGWVIVICGFINHVLTVGLMISLSVFYVSWLDQFGESKGATSWIMSIGVACLFGLCPITASLADRFGFRTMAVIGGFLTWLGLVLSVFATSVNYLVVSIGLISGIGCCFSYLPALATVTMYFDRRRALAMGLNTAGVGIGAFALSPLLNHLEQIYGWRGAMLLLGGITLHMCVTGLLMRDLETKGEQVVVGETSESDEEKQGNEASEGSDFATTPMINFIHDHSTNDNTKICSASKREEDSLVHKTNCVDLDLEKYDFETGKGDTNSLIPQLHNANGLRLHASHDDLRTKHFPVNKTHPSCSFHSLDTRVLDRNCADLSNTKSILNKHPVLLASMPSLLKQKEVSGESLTHDSNVSMNENAVGALRDLEKSTRKRPFISMILPRAAIKRNRELLSNKAHVTYCISNFVTNLSYIAPVVFMVDRAVEQGINKSAGAIFVSANGIGNVAGRIIFGYLADRFRTKHIPMYITALIVCGVGTMLSDLCGDNVFLHAAYASFFGFLMGTYTVLAPTVSVDLVGPDMFAAAYSQTLFCMGIGTIIGPPLAGWLFDWTRSYLLSYLTIGFFWVVSGAMLVPLLCRKCKASSTPMQEG